MLSFFGRAVLRVQLIGATCSVASHRVFIMAIDCGSGRGNGDMGHHELFCVTFKGLATSLAFLLSLYYNTAAHKELINSGRGGEIKSI